MTRTDQIQPGAWCCVQSGHREQYAIPRALHRAGLLDKLITDVWMPPESSLSRLAPGGLGRRMRDRFHGGVPEEKVVSASRRALAWEVFARARGLADGVRVQSHNAWWASLSARMMTRTLSPGTRYVFGYCYGAGRLFKTAREMGLSPVLGQIDPGPVEDTKVAEIVARHRRFRTTYAPCGDEYYESWREECRQADHILVNSEWSREALVKTGIGAGKIKVCPLVYTPPAESLGWQKTYPTGFSTRRPLRVLFLGQCILRKGIAETIEAARTLADKPVEFTLVGNTDIAEIERHFTSTSIRYVPRVSRAECHAFYREADVFLFPTHSDGFGLTQLEAQAWRLPIIASRFCAEVVRSGRTGWVLPEVTGESISEVIGQILADPGLLARYSDSIEPWSFGLDELAGLLGALDAPTAAVR